MGLCRAEEENLNQRKKKSLMKALKMSIIHCSLFIISWTPYTFMATWWEEKTKNLSLEDTHTCSRNLYKVFFQISLHRDMTCNFIVNKQSKQDEKVSSQSSLSGNSLIKAFMVSFPNEDYIIWRVTSKCFFVLQGHHLQGVCKISSTLGSGLILPHRRPQQLHQPCGVWSLLPWREEEAYRVQQNCFEWSEWQKRWWRRRCRYRRPA